MKLNLAKLVLSSETEKGECTLFNGLWVSFFTGKLQRRFFGKL